MTRGLLGATVAGITLLVLGCSVPIPQRPEPRQEMRVYPYPFALVWQASEQVFRAKQARPAIVNQEAGLLRFVLYDGTSITAFVEVATANETRVFVRRNVGARTPVSESAILDEIGAAIVARSSSR
jgi:hypothetical protein